MCISRKNDEIRAQIVREAPKVDGSSVPVDAARLQELTRILQGYKTGKANLERRVLAADVYQHEEFFGGVMSKNVMIFCYLRVIS